MRLKIGILIFDDVEELDFVGPLEAFGVAAQLTGQIDIFILSKEGKPVRARYGLHVLPVCSFSTCPKLDIVIVPGGRGAREHACHDEEIRSFLQKQAQSGRVAAVCTGALILAEAGLLEGRKGITHWSALDLLRGFPGVQVVTQARFVHDGSVSTSAGISAGIDLAISMIREYFGSLVAQETAHIMDYTPADEKPGEESIVAPN